MAKSTSEEAPIDNTISTRTTTSSNEKLDALLRRDAEIKAAIAAEKLKQQKREAKKRKRLIEIIGEEFVAKAEASPEFHSTLNDQLDEIVTDTKRRVFLAEMAYL